LASIFQKLVLTRYYSNRLIKTQLYSLAGLVYGKNEFWFIGPTGRSKKIKLVFKKLVLTNYKSYRLTKTQLYSSKGPVYRKNAFWVIGLTGRSKKIEV